MKKKIYFVLGGFPVVSHPFLYNQISEVINTNRYDVQIISLQKTGEKVHKAYEGLNESIVHFSIGTGNRFLSRGKLIVKSFFNLLFTHPIILLKTLNYSKYSRNAINGNYIILANQFLKIKPDLLHAHFGPTSNIVGDLKEIGAIKCQLLSSFHGMDITVYPKQYGNGYYKRLFKVSEMFTGNSQFIIDKMLETGCPKEKIVKVPECLNIDQFHYRDITPVRDTFRILTVGRFVEKKGYEFSFKAVALLKNAGVSFTYNIIGEGPLKDAMIKLAQDLGIREDLVFHGAMKQEEVKQFYESSHVFLLPSVTAENGDTEGQGLVLQEAQAIGLPVVATLHNGFPDSIIDGSTGYLVPEKDHEALYEKLLVLANNENLCEEMGKLGRSFVEENFDSKIIVKGLTILYENILSKNVAY